MKRPRFLRAGESARDTAKLASGTAVAQFALIAVSPVLTRLYSPADFGALALLLSLSALILTVATGRYEQAIMVAADEATAVSLAYLALVLACVTALVTFLGTLVAVPLFSNADDSLSWLYWLPLLVLITSATAVLSVFAIWRGRLNLAATSSALRGLVMAGLQVAIGFWHPSAFGLAGGHTVGSAAAGFRLAANLLNAAKSNPPSRGSIAAVAKQYSKFPKHTMPAAVLNATTLNGLPPMIGLLFGATTLGLWSLARRVIAVPLMVVGNAVGQVYYRRAAGTRESHGDSMRLYRAAAWRLALLSAPGFLVLLFTAPWVFGFVFGDEWRLAGNYAQIMIPWIWLQFVALPLSRTTLVFERNELDVKVQIAILGVVIATGVGAAIFSWTFLTYLAILSACLAIWHLALLLLYANVIREDAIGEDDEPQAPA